MCALVTGVQTCALPICRPSLQGPVRAERVVCEKDDVEVIDPIAILDADFAEDVHNWNGEGAVRVARLRLGDKRASGLVGTLGFRGNGDLTRGDVTLAAAEGELAGVRAGRMTIAGRYARSEARRGGKEVSMHR